MFSAHSLIMVYICTTFHENISEGFKVIERTRFAYRTLQRGIIPYKYRWTCGTCSVHID